MSSVSVVLPAANFAMTLVLDTGSFGLIDLALSSRLDKMSATKLESPAFSAALARSNQDVSKVQYHIRTSTESKI